MSARLDRTTFSTSRLLDFCSRKELIAQTGHQPDAWPLVVLKELVDNALDACEEAGVAPEITIQVNDAGITVIDNGPGIPVETVAKVLDFERRVSSREAYVAPDRGAQGNALKTIVAMPYVLDGKRGVVEVDATGTRHRIEFTVDPIRQEPVIQHDKTPGNHKNGTKIHIEWPDSPCSILSDSEGSIDDINDNVKTQKLFSPGTIMLAHFTAIFLLGHATETYSIAARLLGEYGEKLDDKCYQYFV